MQSHINEWETKDHNMENDVVDNFLGYNKERGCHNV